jgi:hypothetical protein
MLTSLHYSVAVSVELKPETAIERAYIELMIEAAVKGRTVTLSESTDGGMVVTVPK